MRSNPYNIVKDFEKALCEYTGAKYAVTTTSCTMALLLAVAWHLSQKDPDHQKFWWHMRHIKSQRDLYLPTVEIPKRTYISVPMSIIHAGGHPVFRDENWQGAYQLKPLPVWDCARRFTSGMFNNITASEIVLREYGVFGKMQCVSFHWTKILAIGQGGAILHDNDEADEWFRRMRFDGRTAGVEPKNDVFTVVGWHCMMSPCDAAEGLSRLAVLPDHNADLPNSDYPDLSQCHLFKT